MSLLRSIASGLRSLFRKERVEGDLDEELRGFLDMAAQEKMKEGMSSKDALRAVRLERGSLEVTKEVVRSAGWESVMETYWQDLRFGLRVLTKNPGFTTVAVLTLALGIGANAAIFNTANAALWRTLPVGVAEELRRSGIFSDVITRTDDGLSFSYNGSGAERVVGEVVSPNFFAFLGIRPALGQGFSVGVQKGQWAPEVVLSYRFWQRRFGSDPHVLGHSIRLNNYPFTIVGVSPQDFYSLVVGFDPELRVPQMPPGQSLSQSELLSSRYAEIMARLNPGIGIVQAEAAADAACQQFLRDDQLNRHEVNPTRHIHVASGGRGWQGDLAKYRTSLLVLVGLAGVVLLVTSFNLTSMLLARATTR